MRVGREEEKNMKNIDQKKAVLNDVAWYFFYGLDSNPDLVVQGLNLLFDYIEKEEDEEFKKLLQKIYGLADTWDLYGALEVVDEFLAL